MAHIELSGVRIEYDLLGPEGAHCVAVTPGGRMSMEAGGVRTLGEALAALGKRVLLWDRPNAGLSDLHFEGDNESAMHGRFLTGLIRALGLGPTALAGGSAGSRVSLLAAVQDPEIVSHLAQWWISGGTVSLMMLGASQRRWAGWKRSPRSPHSPSSSPAIPARATSCWRRTPTGLSKPWSAGPGLSLFRRIRRYRA
jgi:pimeloyl-ACP methyl ester carboxylesterase